MLSYRYRLSPTTEQKITFEKWVGCARAVYNAGIEQREVAYKDCKIHLHYFDQTREVKQLRKEISWLSEPPADLLYQSLKDLDNAYIRFFNKQNNYPRFQKKHNKKSFRLLNTCNSIRVKRLNKKRGSLRVPKMGEVRFRWSQKPIGEIKNITIKKESDGWYVYLCCDSSKVIKKKADKKVGIDRGIINTIALSDGNLYYSPTLTPAQLKRKRRLEKNASRQELARRSKPSDQRTRSNRHQKTYDSLARLKAKEARKKKDFNHKLTTDIAKNHSLVSIEDLKVVNMTKSAKGTVENPGKNVAQKRGLNRAILSQNWGQFAKLLQYKIEARDGELIRVDPKFTSQKCAECGTVDPLSRRSQADFECTTCGHSDNADINAAKNVLAAGLVVTARGAFEVVNSGNEPRTTQTGKKLVK